MKKAMICMVALLAWLLAPSLAEAKTVDVHYLLLNHADGTEVKFALTDNPVLTFNEDGELVVSCNGEQVSFDVSTLTTHEIITETVEMEEENATAIARVEAGESVTPSHPAVAFGQAVFSGLKAGQRVSVYTTDGKAVATMLADADGKASVDLTSLPKGVYILRTPNNSYKISNK